MHPKPLPPEDLTHILLHATPAFHELRNANLFITGGTGFFGHWLLESLLHANDHLNLSAKATVLTRSAAAFQTKSPHIANHPAITLLEGDIRTFPFPEERHTHILHAATDSGGQQASSTPEDLYNSILQGTQHVLNFAKQTLTSPSTSGAPGPDSRTRVSTASQGVRLLYTSTGAVYGRSTTLLHTPETYLETHHPQLPQHSYEAAKRAAEILCLSNSSLASEIRNLKSVPDPALQAVIARCFAFVGPHLPLDQHFAIGNFIGAALNNQPIHIKGDGTPRRSWLYMADLAIWLWTLLTQAPANTAWNVGSDEGMTIAEAARLTLETLSSRPERSAVERPAGWPDNAIQIDGTPNPAAPLNSYVPDITQATSTMSLKVLIPLPEALRRTAAWQ